MESIKRIETEPAAGDDVVSIGQFLVTEGKLEQADLDRAALVNENDNKGLGLLLVRLGLVSDRDLAAAYADALALPLLKDEELPEVPLDDCPLSDKFLKEANVVLFWLFP